MHLLSDLLYHTCNSDRFAKPLRTKQWCGPDVASRRVRNTTCARRPSQSFQRTRSHFAHLTIKCSACSSFQPLILWVPCSFSAVTQTCWQPGSKLDDQPRVLRSHQHATTDKTSSTFEQVPRRVKNGGQGVVYFFAVLAQLRGHHQALSKQSLLCLFVSGLFVKPS